MNPCEICKKHKNLNKVIHETENWIITHGPFESQILGYFYMAPKRHIENWFEFTKEELIELGPLIKKVEIAIREELALDRLYTVTISEALRHIHIHLIPREKDNNDVKGLSLIEQATLQNVRAGKHFDENELDIWLEKIKVRL